MIGNNLRWSVKKHYVYDNITNNSQIFPELVHDKGLEYTRVLWGCNYLDNCHRHGAGEQSKSGIIREWFDYIDLSIIISIYCVYVLMLTIFSNCYILLCVLSSESCFSRMSGFLCHEKTLWWWRADCVGI